MNLGASYIPTWDLLIPTIPHRHETLCRLLAELDRQAQPGFGVRVYRDNLDRPGILSYEKWQDLADSSQADYVSWAGDDDMVAPDFVPRIMAALESRPDYVGFMVRFTLDGVLQLPVEHSLRNPGWADWPRMTRDITHFNPVRRELALLARWGTWKTPGEDADWAAALRATGQVKTEEWIPDEMYYYQRGSTPSGNFWATAVRDPVPPEEIKPLPDYPWLTVLKADDSV